MLALAFMITLIFMLIIMLLRILILALVLILVLMMWLCYHSVPQMIPKKFLADVEVHNHRGLMLRTTSVYKALIRH